MSTIDTKQYNVWKRFRKSGAVSFLGLFLFFSGFDIATSQNNPGQQNEALMSHVLSEKQISDENLMSTTNLFQELISGIVTDAATGEPLPGASIVLEGTLQGTTTDMDGRFELEVPTLNETLVVSYIGYIGVQIAIDGRSEVNVALQQSRIMAEEVVITAFGLQREQRSLGTAIGRVSGNDLAQMREVNVSRALAGRVSGLTVTSSAGGAAGSTNVIIRGASSLGGNQQPLYVVDGIPIDNSAQGGVFRDGTGGATGGSTRDLGDGISNINPNDIAEISVLKGPAAAALYGSRGAQGVILITTKTGQSRQGIGVEINSNVSFGTPAVYPRLQNEYGEGSQGQFRFTAPDGNPQLSTSNNGPQHPLSWGPRMDGQQVWTWEGVLEPFSPQNQHKDFYDTELTIDNSVSLSGGNENTVFRLSLNDLNYNGMIPTNEMTRRTVSLRGSHRLSDRLSAEARVSYVNQQAQNRPLMGDAGGNIAYNLRAMPRNISLESMKNYEITQEDLDNPRALHGYGSNIRQLHFSRQWSAATVGVSENPYFVLNNRRIEDTRERVMGHMSVNYLLTDWISVALRAGTDSYNDRIYQFNEIGSRGTLLGNMSDQIRRVRENNADAMISANRAITSDLSASLTLGASYQTQFVNTTGYSGGTFILRELPQLSNTTSATRDGSFGWSEQETQSVFAFGQFNWRDIVYVDWTGRNDWSSTLPVDSNSFFYPSVSTSFVFADAFELTSDILSYGSVRAAWAQAGAAGSPYQLSGAYGLGNQFQGQPTASFTNSLPFIDLKNELSTSVEFGTDLRFFGNRLHIDATYYAASTENQILSISIPSSSGYTSSRLNAGEIKNSGFELMVSGSPLMNPGGLQWDVTVTYAANKNEVVELVEGVDRFLIGSGRNIRVFADPGQPFGAMYAPNRWLRDNQGNRIIDPSSGLPIKESGEFLVGNAQPDWTGGIMNSINYRGLSVSALVDIRMGGKIFAASNVWEALYGTGQRTLEGRDGTFVAEGVVGQRGADGTWTSTGTPNSQQINAQDYWTLTASQETAVTEEFLHDASYIAMRELSIGYTLPTSMISSLGLSNVTVSVSGRNLFYFLRHTDGYSPEAAQFTLGNSGFGIENASYPMARTIGFNLNVGL